MIDFEAKEHYPIDLDRVPPGWSAAFVRDVCSVIQSGFASGEHNAEGSGIPHIRPMNVNREGALDLSVIKSVAEDVDDRRLQRGDVLFNNTNSPVLVGKTAPVTTDANLAFSNHMTRLTPAQGIDHRYLAQHLHYLWMSGFFIRRCSNHVNQASVSAETLGSTIPVAVPPTAQQARIADVVDSALSRLDDAIASLERVQAKLKAYRASVLKAAVEGRLVPTEAELARKGKRTYERADVLLARTLKERRRRWEEAELAKLAAVGKTPKDDKWKAKYKEPEPPDTSELPALPAGWCWVSLAQVLIWLDQGWSPQCAKRTASIEEWGVMKTTAVQHLEYDDAENKALEADFKPRPHLELRPGDLLVTRAGPRVRVGVCCLVRRTRPRVLLCDKVYRARTDESVSPGYIEVVLNSPRVLKELDKLKTGISDSGVNLTQERFLALAVPLPPRSEQDSIELAVGKHLSVIDQVARATTADARRCRRLRQSVLKWAFEGRLVDQDPADEPAEKLLARIRAERAAAPTTKKTRGRKAKAAT